MKLDTQAGSMLAARTALQAQQQVYVRSHVRIALHGKLELTMSCAVNHAWQRSLRFVLRDGAVS